MSSKKSEIIIRNSTNDDFTGIIDMCRSIYPDALPWSEAQLGSHLQVFPEGQFVAVNPDDNKIVGMASSLIIRWDDYENNMHWRDFTASGHFTNHDPINGRTLYGAEVMVSPELQGMGIGKKLYQVRRQLAHDLGLLRIRAGARLRGYHQYASQMPADDYVAKVVKNELSDPTLTFQLRQGFHVLGVVTQYLQKDPESLGYAAVIEWLNDQVASQTDFDNIPKRFFGPSLTKKI